MGMKLKTPKEPLSGMLSDSYRMLFETMTEGVFYQIATGNLVEVNPAALQIFGLKKEEFIGRNSFSEQWDILLEDKTLCTNEKHPSWLALTTGKPVMHQILAIRNAATNQYVWVVINALPQFRKGETQPYCAMVTLHNIMWRKREEDIAKARLKVLEYASGHTLNDLLTATLDELEALTDSNIGFCHFLEADQQTLTLQAWSTRTVKTDCAAEVKKRRYPLSEAGVWVDCVKERHPVIHNDYPSLPHRKGMPAGHAVITRELVAPVLRGDKIVAILGVGNKPTPYNADDVGVVSRFADLAWDIAEKRNAEIALDYNEKFLSTLLGNLPGFVYRCANDANWTMEFVSDGCKEITGYAPEDLINNNKLAYNDVVHPDYRAHLFLKWQSMLKEHKTFEDEYPIITALGETRWVWERGRGLFSEDGTLLYLEGFITDITRRKKSEEALRDSEEKFRFIMEQINEMAYITDNQGIINYVSPISSQIFGYGPEEMQGKSFDRFLDDGSIPMARAAFSQAINTGQSLESLELTMKKKDGSRFAGELHGTIFFHHKYTGTIGLIRDISQRKTREEMLKQKIEELERFAELTIGRELVMVDLKKEINALLWKIGEPEKYRIVE